MPRVPAPGMGSHTVYMHDDLWARILARAEVDATPPAKPNASQVVRDACETYLGDDNE